MKSAVRSFSFGAAILATIGFGAASASGQVVCGSNIIIKAVMTGDLTCPINDPAFTVGSGGSVDMAGHSVTACAGCDGVLLAGAGAKLSNGSILAGGATSRGVVLAGGTHKVENIVVVGADFGFDSSSSTNKLKNCTAINAAHSGFRVMGSKNAISRSHSDGAGEYNFNIAGDNHNLTENSSTNLDGGATGAGFGVVGNANKLSRNNSTGDRGPFGAFVVGGNENKLSLNSVTGSNTNGVLVSGDENKVAKTVANDNATIGIVVVGDFNKLSKNTASDNGDEGITINGDGNNINGSNTNGNGDSGIRILVGGGSDINSLKSNVSMGNGANGVLLEAGVTNSSISKTVALANADPDLQDDNPNCDGNVWAKSIAGTSEVNGVGPPNCIQP
jgi:hypothetical protein